jgi:hypothetical protein
LQTLAPKFKYVAAKFKHVAPKFKSMNFCTSKKCSYSPSKMPFAARLTPTQPPFSVLIKCLPINRFWLRGWLNHKEIICTGAAPLFWNFIFLFERPWTRLVRKIGFQNQCIDWFWFPIFCTKRCSWRQ